MQAVSAGAGEMPADLGQALLRCAQAFTKTSGSSYGTLLATGLMAAAKALKGRETVQASELSGLIAAARDAMQQRGKADLGGKTVLDSLDAIAKATAGLTDPAEVARAAREAAREVMEAFKDRPATVGRARIFAEKSRTMLDPGMLAMTRIVEAVAEGA
jgi:dihydroxyacetone kinase-like protein